MTQVSDVAHGRLVFIDMSSDRKILFYCNDIVYAALLRNDHFYFWLSCTTYNGECLVFGQAGITR
jgi:hypothetical protein